VGDSPQSIGIFPAADPFAVENPPNINNLPVKSLASPLEKTIPEAFLEQRFKGSYEHPACQQLPVGYAHDFPFSAILVRRGGATLDVPA
jgi:hypothetical protein